MPINHVSFYLVSIAAGAIAATAVGNNAHAARAPDACKKGYVYRLATADDHICVTPAVRAQVQKDNKLATSRVTAPGATTCKAGFVPRAANDKDTVCVSSQSSAQALKDNAAAATRLLNPTLAATVAKTLQGGGAATATSTASTTTQTNNPNAQCTILTAKGFGQVVPVTMVPPAPDYALCKVGDEAGYISASAAPGSSNVNAVCQITSGGGSVAVPYSGNPAPQLNTPCTILGQFKGTISRTSAQAPIQ